MALFDKAMEFFAGFSFCVFKYFLQLLKTQMIILQWGKYSINPFIPKYVSQVNSHRSCYIACPKKETIPVSLSSTLNTLPFFDVQQHTWLELFEWSNNFRERESQIFLDFSSVYDSQNYGNSLAWLQLWPIKSIETYTHCLAQHHILINTAILASHLLKGLNMQDSYCVL